jgi:hypothetical protein
MIKNDLRNMRVMRNMTKEDIAKLAELSVEDIERIETYRYNSQQEYNDLVNLLVRKDKQSPKCVVCGGPLGKWQKKFCSPECSNQSKAYRKRITYYKVRRQH